MSARSRRQILMDRMDELESKGLGCKGCSGTCCTYEANSMMVTPLEAFDLLEYLRTNSLLDEELKARCEEAVLKFRLDHQVGNGKRSYLRKTYTCPFFHHKELGCPLPREVKPYGCLAFNAHHAEEKAGEHCYSEKNLLEMVSEEKILNEELRKKHQLIWEKSPLPLALLEIWDKSQ